MEIETLVLKSLTSNEDYARKVIPYLKKDYFSEKHHQIVYLIADTYFRKYNKCASADVLSIELNKAQGLNEQAYNSTSNYINALRDVVVGGDVQWCVDETEKFCQDMAIENALEKAILIHKGDDPKNGKEAIPEILREALSVGFDSDLGHDYARDAAEQYDYYTNPESKIPFGPQISKFNEITNGGVTRKTLNLLIGATHGGKTLGLCDFAAGHYALGYNVLYITLEEAEEKIRTRIDANLLDIHMDDFASMAEHMSKEQYVRKVQRIHEKISSRLVIREFPTGGASVANFRYLLAELKIKENFVPDVIYVDYLNLCRSVYVVRGDNTYTKDKAVAEELRGLGKEANAALFSATQLNRDGFNDSDPDMGQVSDSFGVAFTADFAVILIGSDELERLNQIMFKQEKNRYRNLGFCKRFVMGIDRQHMRLYDAEASAQPPPSIDDSHQVRAATTQAKARRFKNFQ